MSSPTDPRSAAIDRERLRLVVLAWRTAAEKAAAQTSGEGYMYERGRVDMADAILEAIREAD